MQLEFSTPQDETNSQTQGWDEWLDAPMDVTKVIDFDVQFDEPII